MSNASDNGSTIPSSNELATMRTAMASDRTLMAWVRTALSLFSFGFTIYKVLDGLVQAGQITRTNSPQTVGLALVFMGTLAMVMGLAEYRHTLVQLGETKRFSWRHPSFIMAMVMAIGGVALFVSIALRAV